MLIPESEQLRGPRPVLHDFHVEVKPRPDRFRLPSKWRPLAPEVRVPVPELGDPVPDVAKWLDRLYELCRLPKPSPAIDLVLEAMDDLIRVRNYERCDRILKEADTGKLSVHAMLALLMETFRARSVLQEREGFYLRVEEKLRMEAPERADKLLAGLR